MAPIYLNPKRKGLLRYPNPTRKRGTVCSSLTLRVGTIPLLAANATEAPSSDAAA
jgi:hypothetical protein